MKWILGGLAAILAIALAVVITVVLVRPDNTGNGPSKPGTSGSGSEFASANDTGPVNIITEEPTCDSWRKVQTEFSDKLSAVSWSKRDPSIPATAWTPDQRSMYKSAGEAMTRAADQIVALVTRTPHRVIRELYEQFTAYGHAFTGDIDSYTEKHNALVIVTNSTANALDRICAAIAYGSASPVAPWIKDGPPPTSIAPIMDRESSPRFLESENAVCAEWASVLVKFDDETVDWFKLDPNIPAAKLTPEQRAVIDAVGPVMSANADEMERVGGKSGNPILEDFATLAAQYRRAYVKALPTYTPHDTYLANSAAFLAKTVDWACKAAS